MQPIPPPGFLPPSSLYPDVDAPPQRVYTWASESDVTVDDVPGAGRLVGKLISRWARPVEALITAVSAMVGQGPTKPMHTIIKSLLCSGCSKPYYGAEFIKPSKELPADVIIRELAVRSIACIHCGAGEGTIASSDKKSSKACGTMVKLVGTRNRTSQNIAVLYINFLSVTVPGIREVFLKHDVKRALQILQSNILFRPNNDLDFLLAASRRALTVLEDHDIHALGKELVAQWEGIQVADGVAYLEQARRKNTMQMHLLPYFSIPSHQAIACAILIRAGSGRAMDVFWGDRSAPPMDNFRTWYSSILPQFPLKVAIQRLSRPRDVAVRSVLSALLAAIRKALLGLMARLNEPMTPIQKVLQGSDWESRMLEDFLRESPPMPVLLPSTPF